MRRRSTAKEENAIVYKGHGIRVYWTDSDMGFRYIIFGQGMEVVDKSREAYFYSENAMAAAKKKVDAMTGEKA